MTKLSHKMQNALYLSTSYPNEEKNEFFLKIRLCQLLDIKTTNFMQKKNRKKGTTSEKNIKLADL